MSATAEGVLVILVVGEQGGKSKKVQESQSCRVIGIIIPVRRPTMDGPRGLRRRRLAGRQAAYPSNRGSLTEVWGFGLQKPGRLGGRRDPKSPPYYYYSRVQTRSAGLGRQIVIRRVVDGDHVSVFPGKTEFLSSFNNHHARLSGPPPWLTLSGTGTERLYEMSAWVDVNSGFN